MIVVLASVLTFGTTIVAGAAGYSWEVRYRDGSTELYETVDPRLDLQARSGLCFTVTVCAAGLCSTPSYEICSDPLVGDTSPFDGGVGGADFLAVRKHFGEVAP